MNVFKSPLRKATTLVAGSVLGLTGVLAFAGPASAHHADVTAYASCVKADGTWDVKWVAKSSERDIEGKVTAVVLNPADSPVTGITVGTVVPKAGTDLVGTQTLKAGTGKAYLKLDAAWQRGNRTHTGSRDAWINKPTQVCKPTKPTPSASVSVSPSASVSPSTSVSPSASVSVSPSGSASVSVPPASPSASVSVPPLVPDLPEVTEQDVIVEFTCDTMTLGLHNPTKDVDFTLTFKTSKGETRTVVVKPGETKSEKFSATEGFKIDWTLSATVDGKVESETITIPFTAAADCSDGEGGGLPVTGAAAGGVAAGAAGLLAVGAGLFFMARRRKVNFTA